MADELDEDEESDYYDDDAQAVDEEEWDEETWYGEEDWDEEVEDEDWDDDQIAHVDEEGYFYADEDTIDQCDAQLAQDDDEFCAILTTYTEARGALARTRIARGFYPVVVPADSGTQPRFGRKRKGHVERKTKRKRQRETTTTPPESKSACKRQRWRTTTPMGPTRSSSGSIKQSCLSHLLSLRKEGSLECKLHKPTKREKTNAH